MITSPTLPSFKLTSLFFFLLLSIGLVIYYLSSSSANALDKELESSIQSDLALIDLNQQIDYKKIKPLLDNRCVVCHGCYDAPCQLKLSSAIGLKRGASSELVYDPKRIIATQPTRLFIDAKTPNDWRNMNFHSVLNESKKSTKSVENAENAENNLKNSVLYRLLHLKQKNPQPIIDKLPKNFTLELNREQSCPTSKSINEYSKEHPQWGMPYAMPNLSNKEYYSLVTWIAQGSK